jgi:DNA mismatch repair protein MutH
VLRKPAPQTLRELEVRAEALAGCAIADLALGLRAALPEEPRRAKGFVGSLVEAALGADPTAGERPDFLALGVELKTVPIRASGQPAESTFCCSIAMASADLEEWETSRLRRRLMRVLFVPVEAASVRQLPDRRFGAPRLWTPSCTELDLIRADWEDLMGAVGAGRVPSAHEGQVLQIRPKAASAAERTLAAGNDGMALALPLGFYLRARFTAGVLAGALGAYTYTYPR